MEKTKVKKPIWQRLVFIASIVALVAAVAVCSVCLFQRFYYTPFWVNGQSMYPTLNKDAKYKDGTLIGETRTRGEEEGIYDVDYGFMISNQGRINSIKRFDIIVCKYTPNQASYNIKRVIALPGEKFYFVSNPGKADNGSLYVYNTKANDYQLVKQPLDSRLVEQGNYPAKYAEPTELGPEEYFVVGDNRIGSNSYDSRVVGPIEKVNILGVAAGLNGKAVTGYNSEGVYGPISVSHHWPIFF